MTLEGSPVEAPGEPSSRPIRPESSPPRTETTSEWDPRHHPRKVSHRGIGVDDGRVFRRKTHVLIVS